MINPFTPQRTQPQQPTCDHCRRTFTPQPKDEPLPDGGAERLFSCPHCQHRYHVARITETGVKLLQEAQQLRADIRQGWTEEKQAALDDVLAKLGPEVTK